MTLLPVSTAREAAGLARTLLVRRPLALTACLLMFSIEGLAGLVAPWMLGRIVDVVDSGGTREDVVIPVLWILGAALVGGVATALSISLLAEVAEPALADLREQVLDRAIHLDSAELEAAGSGDLLSRVGDDVRIVAGSFTEVIPIMLTSAIAVVFTAAGLFALDWRLGLAGLGAVPFYVLSLRWYLPRSAPYYRREREANGERAEALLTGVHASRTLRAYGLGGRHQVLVEEASWKSTQISIDVFRLLTRFFGRNNRAELIGLLLIMVTGFVLVRSDQASVGAVTAAALFFHRLFNPIGALVTLFDEVQSAGASLTRLAAGPAAATSAAATPLPPRPPTPDSRCAASTTSTSPAGTRSTPSTSTSGPASGWPWSARAAPASPRSASRWPAAAPDPRGGADRRRTPGRPGPRRAAAGRAGHPGGPRLLGHGARQPHPGGAGRRRGPPRAGARRGRCRAAVHALPEGLDTVVGDGALSLTPALAQQLALARVLLADPLVAVLDEATAEAGSAGARDLDRAAEAVTRNRTSLTIAHRLSQARDADRILVMDAGRVVEAGSHDELVALGGTYARLWAAWAGAGTGP